MQICHVVAPPVLTNHQFGNERPRLSFGRAELSVKREREVRADRMRVFESFQPLKDYFPVTVKVVFSSWNHQRACLPLLFRRFFLVMSMSHE